MEPSKHFGYIARPVKLLTHDGKGNVAKVEIDRFNRICIDLEQPGHAFLVAATGSGKSYTAGVIAEELVDKMDSYGVLFIDPLRNFSTLNTPNSNLKEINEWNEQLPNDVVPRAIKNCTIWVPEGDAPKFMAGMYDRTFSIAAPEFTHDLFSYAFDMDVSDPQVSLFRKCHKELSREKPRFTIGALIDHVREHGRDFKFQNTTIEALISKLDAFGELGIISEHAPGMEEILKESMVSVLDLSQTARLTARLVVEFLVMKIHALRTRIEGIRRHLKAKESQMPKMSWYIPPVQLVIDEAHRYINGKSVIELAFSEGRQIGVTVTAISQSANLSEDVYKSLAHLWIGPQVYDPVIQQIRAMIPAKSKIKPQGFNAMLNDLEVGYWIYFNIKDKRNPGPFLCRVRPRRTLHLAESKIEDESQYFIDPDAPLKAHHETQARLDALEYAFAFDSTQDEFTAVCKGNPGYKTNERKYNMANGRYVKVDDVFVWSVEKVADEFVMAVTAKGSRKEAINHLQQEGVKQLTVLHLRYVTA